MHLGLSKKKKIHSLPLVGKCKPAFSLLSLEIAFTSERYALMVCTILKVLLYKNVVILKLFMSLLPMSLLCKIVYKYTLKTSRRKKCRVVESVDGKLSYFYVHII